MSLLFSCKFWRLVAVATLVVLGALLALPAGAQSPKQRLVLDYGNGYDAILYTDPCTREGGTAVPPDKTADGKFTPAGNFGEPSPPGTLCEGRGGNTAANLFGEAYGIRHPERGFAGNTGINRDGPLAFNFGQWSNEAFCSRYPGNIGGMGACVPVYQRDASERGPTDDSIAGSSFNTDEWSFANPYIILRHRGTGAETEPFYLAGIVGGRVSLWGGGATVASTVNGRELLGAPTQVYSLAINLTNVVGLRATPDEYRIVWEGKSGLFEDWRVINPAPAARSESTWDVTSNVYYLRDSDFTSQNNRQVRVKVVDASLPGKRPAAANWGSVVFAPGGGIVAGQVFVSPPGYDDFGRGGAAAMYRADISRLRTAGGQAPTPGELLFVWQQKSGFEEEWSDIPGARGATYAYNPAAFAFSTRQSLRVIVSDALPSGQRGANARWGRQVVYTPANAGQISPGNTPADGSVPAGSRLRAPQGDANPPPSAADGGEQL